MANLVIDPYSFYDFKEAFSRTSTSGRAWFAPTWITDETDNRRLVSYMMLESYYRLNARKWLHPDAPEDTAKTRREYGDPHLIVNQTLSSLFGVEQQLTVEGALGEEQDDQGNIIGALKPQTVQYQAVSEWMTRQRYYSKMIESERNAVKLGDGVYVLDFFSGYKDPVLHVFDPGFYFPVLDPLDDGEYPRKVHIAYEFIDTDKKTKVRKRTWELVEVSGPWTPFYSTEPTNMACLYSDGVWDAMEIGKSRNALDSSAPERWLTPPEVLPIDFIPVVHIPNTVAGSEHFGTSVLAPTIQILDDLIATDTDLQAAGATTGSPPIAISGATVGQNIQVYGPGTVLNVGEGGATVIDTSDSLRALLELREALLERLSVNSRIPEALLGRVKPSEVPSGLAMALGFTPHTSLISEMRLVRWEKYGILFKFICRFLQMAGHMPLTELFPTNMVFGSYLPADKVETMNLVVQGLTAHAMSMETAVRMLENAGIPIDDVLVEIDRIIKRDYAAANEAAMAAADPNFARQLLGLPPIDLSMLDEDEGDGEGGGGPV